MLHGQLRSCSPGPQPVRLRHVLPGGRRQVRGEAHRLQRPPRRRVRFEAGLVDQPARLAGRLLPQGAIPGRRIDFAEYRTNIRLGGDEDRQARAGDRHDLPHGLRLRHRVHADRRGPIPRGGREGHRVPARPHALRRRGDDDIVYWSHGINIDGGREQKLFASEFGDDYDAIPAYEQIYALAGPTQTFRVTGDRASARHRPHMRLFDTTSATSRAAATSRTSTR